MAQVVADRVRDTTTTTGTGAVTVSGTAPATYKTFSARCSVNDTLAYFIAHQTLDEWECGVATYSAANQLTRTTVLSSSNSDAVVNFSAGTKDVVLTQIANRGYQQTGFTGLSHTVTSSVPALDLSQTWNNSGTVFTAIKMDVTDTASATGSLWFDLQRGGTSILSVGNALGLNRAALNLAQFSEIGLNQAYLVFGGTRYAGFTGTGMLLAAGSDSIGWVNGADVLINAPADSFFGRITGAAAGTYKFGAADMAAPVAQTLRVQNVVAGTSNTAGQNWTFIGSCGTGTGIGGDIIFQTAPAGGSGTSQNSAAEVVRILNTGNMKYTNAANFSANGSVATVLGSVGPTGANTTVQKWLTFVDNGGATRYVPCF